MKFQYQMSALAAITVWLAVLGSCDAKAEGLTLNLGGVSHHFRNDKEHNDVNEGIGLEWDASRVVGVAAGGYYNSDSTWSQYVYVRYQPFNIGGTRIGALAGLVTGYKKWGCSICPAGLLAVSHDYGPVTLSLVGFPNIGKAVDGVVSLQIGVKLP